MRGKWVDINVFPSFFGIETVSKARGFFRHDLLDNTGRFSEIYAADFIYLPREEKILKNRHGTTEQLFDDANKYMALKHHSNEQVRKLIQRAEILAILAEE